MRALLGISTRDRDTSPRVFIPIAPLFEHILVVAQGDCGNFANIPPEVAAKLEVIYQAPSLAASRNRIFQYALDNDYEVVVQSDDDIRLKLPAAEYMLQLILQEPSLGSVSVAQDFLWVFGDRTITCSKPWLIAPWNGQFWGMRVETLRTELEPPYTRGEVLDDVDFGMRLWQRGLATVRLHRGRDDYCVAIMPRTTTGYRPRTGGQPLIDRIHYIRSTYKEVRQRWYPDFITKLEYRLVKEDVKIDIRYNWSNMIKTHIDRWGNIGYEDSKGRKM
jgi:hypothetical protein